MKLLTRKWLCRSVLYVSLLAMVAGSQCALASQVKQVARRLHRAQPSGKATHPLPVAPRRSAVAASANKAHNGITSNAFNFASLYGGSVDGRTGSYSFNATLGKVYGNAGFGPHYTFALHYSSSTPRNLGYGAGWSDSLSHYDNTTQMLQLATGGRYKLHWSGTTPSIRYYKLDNLHLRGDASGRYLLIATHKDGSEEYFNHDGNVVRLENTRGDSLYFHYVGPQSAGRLGRITDDRGQTLLQIDYTGFGLLVHSRQADGSMNTVKVLIQNGHLQHLLFADGQTQVAFHYLAVLHFPVLLREIDYSSGAKETLQYSTLAVPTGGAVANMYAVKSHTVAPGFGQPAIRTDYRYGLTNGHNYLGYASGVQFRQDVDNLYMRPDNYTYQTAVRHYQGASVIATYNKYHLMLSQKLYTPGTHRLVSEVDYQYPNWLASTIVSLPANYALATKITTIAYPSVTPSQLKGIPSAIKHTTCYQYDEQGNLLRKVSEDGTVTDNQYAPADANGFVNNLSMQTVTPARVAGTPVLSPTQTQITYQTLPSKDKAMPVGITLPQRTTLRYQQTPGHWTATTTLTTDYHTVAAQADYAMPTASALTHVDSSLATLNKHISYTHGQTLVLWGKRYRVDIKQVQLSANGGKLEGPSETVYTSINTGQTLETLDALGNKTAYAYDALGRVVEVALSDGTGVPVIKRYVYHSDGQGNRLTVIAPNGYQTRQTYDGLGRVLSTQTERLDKTGQAVPDTWDTLSRQRYTATGKVASKTVYDTDETGTVQTHVTTNHYDSVGRLVSQTQSTGHAAVMGVDVVMRRHYVYALYPMQGTVKGTSLCTVKGAAHACGTRHLQVMEKDARGDTVATYLFSLDPSITNDQGQPLYTGDLKRALQSHLAADIAKRHAFATAWLQGWLRDAIAAKAYYTVTHATYNAAHQVLTSTDTDGHQTGYRYDRKGRLEAKTLANGAIQTYAYDANDKLIRVGNATTGQAVTLGTRRYDALGRLRQSTDVLGHHWDYTYNPAGELTGYSTPNGAHIQYGYDRRGNLITQSVTGYPDETVHRVYDSLTNALTTRQDKTGTTHYAYAANGRLWSISNTALTSLQGDALPAFSEQYRYTWSGKPVSVTNAAGGASHYHYDSQGRLVGVDDNGKPIAHYGFDSAGRLTTARKGPVETRYTYNTLGQLSAYQTDVINAKGAKSVAAYHFSYAQDGNLRERVRFSAKGPTTEVYQYDSLNNLRNYACSGPLCPKDNQGHAVYQQAYTFDRWNNIHIVATVVATAAGRQTNTTTYHYDPHDPLHLLRYTNSNPAYGQSATLVYDNDGNITTNAHNKTITYTPFDQIASVNTAAGPVGYLYNGAHEQVRETAPNQAPLYFEYGAAGLSALQQNKATTRLLYAGGRIGEITPDGQVHYAITDQSGSVLSEAVVDTQGKVSLKGQHLYTPYGVEGKAKAVSTALVGQNLWGFDGQLQDPESGYQFLGQGYHRAYNPVMRRFMSMDSASPFGKGGFNGYIFARNNPVMYADPSGHMPELLSWLLIGLSAVVSLGTATPVGAVVGFGVATSAPVALGAASTIEAKQGHQQTAKALGIAGGVLGIVELATGTGEAIGETVLNFSNASTLLKVIMGIGDTVALSTTGETLTGEILTYSGSHDQNTIDILTYLSLGQDLFDMADLFVASRLIKSVSSDNIETQSNQTEHESENYDIAQDCYEQDTRPRVRQLNTLANNFHRDENTNLERAYSDPNIASSSRTRKLSAVTDLPFIRKKQILREYIQGLESDRKVDSLLQIIYQREGSENQNIISNRAVTLKLHDDSHALERENAIQEVDQLLSELEVTH